jgi:hypothetical protein
MNDASELSVIAPVCKSVIVRLLPREAFALFTEELSKWWPLATHSCAGARARGVVIEPRVGGAVTEHAVDGAQAPWGTVLAWEPPEHFAMSWHPARPEDEATRVDVRFAAAGEGLCRVDLTHSGWERRADAAASRQRYEGGWETVLAAYAAAARGGFDGGR